LPRTVVAITCCVPATTYRTRCGYSTFIRSVHKLCITRGGENWKPLARKATFVPLTFIEAGPARSGSFGRKCGSKLTTSSDAVAPGKRSCATVYTVACQPCGQSPDDPRAVAARERSEVEERRACDRGQGHDRMGAGGAEEALPASLLWSCHPLVGPHAALLLAMRTMNTIDRSKVPLHATMHRSVPRYF